MQLAIFTTITFALFGIPILQIFSMDEEEGRQRLEEEQPEWFARLSFEQMLMLAGAALVIQLAAIWAISGWICAVWGLTP